MSSTIIHSSDWFLMVGGNDAHYMNHSTLKAECADAIHWRMEKWISFRHPFHFKVARFGQYLIPSTTKSEVEFSPVTTCGRSKGYSRPTAF